MEFYLQIGSWIVVGLIAIVLILVVSRILDIVLSGVFKLLGGILLPLFVLILSTGLGAYIGYQMDARPHSSGKNLIIGALIGAVIGNIIIFAFPKGTAPPPGSSR